MKNLAVLFPGINYNTDKPLLYYAGKIAKKYEFDVVNVSYGNLPDGNKEKMFDYALMSANTAINKIAFEAYDSIFFISKSIGTLVAGTIQKSLPQQVHSIFFTPVSESVPFLCKDSIVFTGNRDSYIHVSEVVKRQEEMGFDLHIAKEANHSLETGDVLKDIMVLRKIEELCEQYMVKHISKAQEDNPE